MKIIGVYCSGYTDSTSGKMVDALLDGARQAGAQVSQYRIGNSDMKGCLGCHSCQEDRGTATECVIGDILKPYWSDIAGADILIVGAGNYMGDVQAQAYTFLNRHFCLKTLPFGGSCRIPAGKKIIGVFAQGMPKPDAYLEKYKAYLKHFGDWGMVIEDIIVGSGASVNDEFMSELSDRGRALV